MSSAAQDPISSDDAVHLEEVLHYWFGALDAADDVSPDKAALWWQGGEAVDREIRARFGDLVARALAGELEPWRATPRGCLALVILLDQFTRNLGRGTPAAFAGDERALDVAIAAIDAGLDQPLRLVERGFLYMPLMHAEDRDVARRSVATFAALSAQMAQSARDDLPDFHPHALQHAEVVQRFGRYPHRNAILAREPTAEEQRFLAGGGPSWGQAPR